MVMNQAGDASAVARTILIIDDEAAVRNVTRTLLERAGYRVLTAAGGPEGVDVFAGERDAVDLVILDLSMPIMSGREVLAELTRLRPDVRVVVSSGYHNPESAPAPDVIAGFLQKPSCFDELLRVVEAGMAPKSNAE